MLPNAVSRIQEEHEFGSLRPPEQSNTMNSQLSPRRIRTRKGETAAFEVVVRRFERSLRTWLAGHVPPGPQAAHSGPCAGG
jgi:hypothetical protein